MQQSDILIFFISVALMLLVARVFAEMFRKLKQPGVIGEILAGILLGPTCLGMLAPDTFNFLFRSSAQVLKVMEGLTLLAVVMLLLVSGIEVELTSLRKRGKAALSTAVMGVAFPFVVAFAGTYAFPEYLGKEASINLFHYAMFIGTAMSITALPVVARTLMDMNMFKSEIGTIIIASAMFNDLTGWIIFSFLLSLINIHANSIGLSSTITLLVSFIAFSLLILRKLINYILPYVETKLSYPGATLNIIFVLGFLGAAFTEYIGVHAILGAFIIGVAVGDSVHLKESTREIIQQFITNIFAPLFFVSIGLKINFITNFNAGYVVVFLVLAFVTKVVGCSLGAYWGGMSKDQSLAIGFGMNSRGVMEIVLGLLALQYKLINEQVFVALVIMALVTSLSSAPLMSRYIRRFRINESFLKYVVPGGIVKLTGKTTEEIIRKQWQVVSPSGKYGAELPEKLLSSDEMELTYLGKGIALPHLRMDIPEPVLSIALLPEPMNYFGDETKPVSLVFLLLVPQSRPDIHISVISSIARLCKDDKNIKAMINSGNEQQLKKAITAALVG